MSKAPQGVRVESPANKTRAELLLMRSRCDRDEIERRTALGIAASLDARRIEDIEDRVRETEEMSTVGLEVSLEEKAKTLRILKQQKKQIVLKENTSKFGKVKLGVHG